MISLQIIRNFAIILIYAVLLGTSTYDKWKSLTTPDWFKKQFENTFIHRMPGGTVLGYWFIATFEALLTAAFVISFFNMAVLPFALLGSLFLFGVLLFGLRLISDFQGSANMFVYFGTTLVSLYLVTL